MDPLLEKHSKKKRIYLAPENRMTTTGTLMPSLRSVSPEDGYNDDQQTTFFVSFDPGEYQELPSHLYMMNPRKRPDAATTNFVRSEPILNYKSVPDSSDPKAPTAWDPTAKGMHQDNFSGGIYFQPKSTNLAPEESTLFQPRKPHMIPSRGHELSTDSSTLFLPSNIDYSDHLRVPMVQPSTFHGTDGTLPFAALPEYNEFSPASTPYHPLVSKVSIGVSSPMTTSLRAIEEDSTLSIIAPVDSSSKVVEQQASYSKQLNDDKKYDLFSESEVSMKANPMDHKASSFFATTKNQLKGKDGPVSSQVDRLSSSKGEGSSEKMASMPDGPNMNLYSDEDNEESTHGSARFYIPSTEVRENNLRKLEELFSGNESDICSLLPEPNQFFLESESPLKGVGLDDESRQYLESRNIRLSGRPFSRPLTAVNADDHSKTLSSEGSTDTVRACKRAVFPSSPTKAGLKRTTTTTTGGTPKSFYEILPNRNIVYYHYRQTKDAAGNVVAVASDPIICTIEFESGAATYIYPNGQTEIYYKVPPLGYHHTTKDFLKHKVVFKDGTVMERFLDGCQRVKYPDGLVLFQKPTNTLTTCE